MVWYHGSEPGHIPGAFPEKWWEGSALFYALLNYWHFTGDDTYNDQLSLGLQWQSGTNGDYLPSNYSHFLVRQPLRSHPVSFHDFVCIETNDVARAGQ